MYSKMTLFFLLLGSFLTIKAQNHVDPKRIMKAQDTLIAFNMEIGGKSKVVKKFTDLLKNKNYSEIKKLLTSKNNAEKFLAAMTCNELFRRKYINLSDEQKQLIKIIYESEDIVYGLNGCTYISAKPIREYFYTKDDKLIIGQFEIWFEQYIE